MSNPVASKAADEAEAALATVTADLSDGGEHRPGQIEMARAVAQSIALGRHLVVQAGTGTGKSLAYLIPAVLSGKRVIVATATKALQDQLAKQELPHLSRALPSSFDWAVLKGRNNYVCRQRVNELSDDTQLVIDGVSDKQRKEVDKLLAWSDTSESGDRAELDFEPSASAWAAVSVSSRECPGMSRCPAGQTCFTEAARSKAASADVVVVNTHLLGINLVADGVVLPEHDVVIIDEAHQLEDIISSTNGWSLSAPRFSAFARTLGRVLDDEDTTGGIDDAAHLIDRALEPLTGQRIQPGASPDLGTALTVATQKVGEAVAKLRELPTGKNTDTDARRVRAMQLGGALLEDIVATTIITDADVAWVETDRGTSTLRAAPLDVGEVLAPKLFSESPTILTSATLGAGLPDSLGLIPDSFERVDVASPFDYESAGLLYCAAHLPEPRSPTYEEEFLPHLESLIVAAGGRTLGLFTSWRMMDVAADHLKPRLPWTLYTQRDLPKPALIEAFRSDPTSVLLATIGFWQGIDVPGAALSLVTIDRLPFPRPDDPLLEARRENARANAFRVVDLPRATTLLAQGAGRLIRSQSDRGVVAVLDGRLATRKSYRWEFINTLPPFSRTGDPDVVIAHLKSLRDEASENEAD